MALGAKVKGITVKIGADTTDVGAALASAKTQASALGKELAGVNRGLKFSPASADLLAQRHHVLSKRVEEASRKLVALKSAEEKVEELFRKGKIDQSEYLAFKGDVATAESQLRTFARQLSDTAEQIARIDTNSATAGDKIVELAGRSDAMMAFGKGASAITAGLAAVGQQSVKYALELESAFAGVRKTVDATEAEYAELRAAATGMSEQKVVSAAQVADIMALGGQLGIATGELEGFASTVADLDVSTDLGAEQAATEMAQFANITGMAQGDLGRLASTLVDLGNSSATTESRIMGMGMRIAGAGSQVGLSEQQVLALSAALSSVGIEAEAGGSAVSATLSRIDTDVATNADSLATWAGLAGVSVGEFSALWRRDALGAFQAVMAGMSGAKAEGENLGVILDGLGVTGLRQTDMLKRLSGASDLLGRSVSTANRAWDENTALSKEAAARYATTESQGAMLLNRLKNIAAEMGGPMLGAINGLVKDAGPFLDALTGMAEGYAGLSDGARAAVNMFVLSAAAIGPVNMAMGKLMPLTAKVVTGYRTISDAMRANAAARAALDVANKGGIVTAGASTAATAAATAATGANTAATAANSAGAKLAAVSTNVLTFAVKALSLAWATNPVAVVTVALAALAGVVALVATKTSGLGDEYAGLTQASRAQGRAVDDLRARYEAFTDEERATSEEAGRVAAELDEAEAAFERNRRTVEELTEEIREAREGYLEWSDGLADAEAD
ncbi:MAG: phage tail tape measure protein, partial [Coriobacteriales bacterium]|nr:phage tail tape measure protein [Coriobacteriales bacterium]